jgi:hypothetical protein
LHLLLQGNGILWLFTTAAYGATQVGQQYAYQPMIFLAGALQNPCSMNPQGGAPRMCSAVTVNRAALGFADPWLSYTLFKTAAKPSQGKLELQVVTFQDFANSAYARIQGASSMYQVFRGIPFNFAPDISPSDALACASVPVIRNTNGAWPYPQIVECDVTATPSSGSFALLAPNPRRLIDSNGTGPVNDTWTLGQTEFDVIAG